MTAPNDWWDMIDQRAMLDKAEPMLIDEPIETMDANDPMLPMDANDPTLPIDSIDPSEAIDRNELRDHSDRLGIGSPRLLASATCSARFCHPNRTRRIVTTMGARQLAYRWYAGRLSRQLSGRPMPRHLALIVDGNRRWARQMGYANVSVGHRFGAEHLEDVLGWCAGLGISHVTIFVASADNLAKRSEAEVSFLMEVAERIIGERLARPDGDWQIHLAGRLDLLPDSTAHALKQAVEVTSGGNHGCHLMVAIGYGGRAEIVEAVRGLLDDAALAGRSMADLAGSVTAADIAAHLYTQGMPDPDLVIRTSGEQRLSDFLIWQTTGSELYFCDVYWPGFRHVDFLRALRAYASRRDPGVSGERRAGRRTPR